MKTANYRMALIVLLFWVVNSPARAEDPKERFYHVPALHPKHKDKPKVTGWAKQRIDEKINRGMLAIPSKEGKVYLGWRLLKSDAEGTVFNVYRAVADGDTVKLSKKPVTATTDFIDEQPILDYESAYWVRPVVGGQGTGYFREGAVEDGRQRTVLLLVYQIQW